jgi:UDP-N-acetylglucosamine diphosphorylase/glucosamine-1-phosphate N-acetyltransferase
MAGTLVVFEDDRCCDLYPLTLTRPVFDLVCGIFTLGEKLRMGLEKRSRGGRPAGSGGSWGPADLRFHMRDYLVRDDAAAVKSYAAIGRDAGQVTFLNGRWICCESILEKLDPGWVGKYVSGDTVVAATLPGERVRSMDCYLGAVLESRVFADLPVREVDACVITYPWDLVSLNGREIRNDFGRLGAAAPALDRPGVSFVGREAMRIGDDVALSPGVVIDASEGPVSIAGGAAVMANASLKGPLHIGAGTLIKMGAAIYGDTSIGPMCKVGGEVAESIIHGHSNKQHGGFLGHSYLGEWVNLGAGTNTSDMKNNYSTIRISVGCELVDSGQMFAGLFMGDHSKSGIGTIFNTGSSVGACCNVFGADYPPKHIPSFVWGGGSEFSEHGLVAALETARRAMERRGKIFGPRDERLLARVFELTRGERAGFLGR